MLLQQLVEDDCIAEVILIDNTAKGFEYPSEKVKVIVPKKNLYVNPAWNLGVLNSSCDYIGLVNDDLIFPKNFFSQIFKFVSQTQNIGFCGIESVPKTNENYFADYPAASILSFLKIEKRTLCWGSAIFFRKENYINIPEKLKVFCGDDFLFYVSLKNNYDNYLVKNTNIFHLHSLTSGLKQFDKIKYKDQLLYKKINPLYSFTERQNFSFWERVFSIKKSEDKRCLIFHIFGLKITIRKKI